MPFLVVLFFGFLRQQLPGSLEPAFTGRCVVSIFPPPLVLAASEGGFLNLAGCLNWLNFFFLTDPPFFFSPPPGNREVCLFFFFFVQPARLPSLFRRCELPFQVPFPFSSRGLFACGLLSQSMLFPCVVRRPVFFPFLLVQLRFGNVRSLHFVTTRDLFFWCPLLSW